MASCCPRNPGERSSQNSNKTLNFSRDRVSEKANVLGKGSVTDTSKKFVCKKYSAFSERCKDGDIYTYV